MFYGVYYGVLGRDIAEICTETMASRIGVTYHKLPESYSDTYLVKFYFKSITLKPVYLNAHWRQTCVQFVITK